MGSGLILIADGMSGLSSLGSGSWVKPPLMELLNSELENLVKIKVPAFNSVIWEKKTFSLAAVRKRQCAGPHDVGVITLPTDAVWCYHTLLWKYHSPCLCYYWMSLLPLVALVKWLLSRSIDFAHILLKILNIGVELDINMCLMSLNTKLKHFAKISWNRWQ